MVLQLWQEGCGDEGVVHPGSATSVSCDVRQGSFIGLKPFKLFIFSQPIKLPKMYSKNLNFQ